MARIIYGAIVESIRGSIGGTTFQKNAYGYTVKKKPNIIRPNRSAQNRQKKYLAYATQSWGALSDAQRTDWNTWASTYPQYAKHNSSSQLSGYSVFVRTHVFLFMSAESVVTAPNYSLAEADTNTATITTNGTDLDFVFTSFTDDDEWNILVNVSRQFGAAQNFIGTKPRFMFDMTNSDSTTAFESEYAGVFGSLPAIGDRVAVSMQFYNPLNGQVASLSEQVVTVIEQT